MFQKEGRIAVVERGSKVFQSPPPLGALLNDGRRPLLRLGREHTHDGKGALDDRPGVPAKPSAFGRTKTGSQTVVGFTDGSLVMWDDVGGPDGEAAYYPKDGRAPPDASAIASISWEGGKEPGLFAVGSKGGSFHLFGLDLKPLKLAGAAGAAGVLRSHPSLSIWLEPSACAAKWAPKQASIAIFLERGPLAMVQVSLPIGAFGGAEARTQACHTAKRLLERGDVLGAIDMVKSCADASRMVDGLTLVCNHLLREATVQAEEKLIQLLAGGNSIVDMDEPLFQGIGGEERLEPDQAERVRLLRVRLFHVLVRQCRFEQAAGVAARVGPVSSAHRHVLLDGHDVYSDLHMASFMAGVEKQKQVCDFAAKKSSALYQEDAKHEFKELVLDEMKMEDLGLEEVDATGIRLEARGRLVEAGAYYDSMGQYMDSNRVHHYKSLMEEPLTGTMQDFEPVELKPMTTEAVAREKASADTGMSKDELKSGVASSTLVQGVNTT